MGAYGLDERFKHQNLRSRLTEPPAYDAKPITCNFKPNKYPFASGSARNTLIGPKSYTDNIYNVECKHTIPSVPWFKSKTPRFKYKPFSEEDLEELLCRCGLENVCECPIDDEPVPIICQRKVRKRLYKGPPPHCQLGAGLSVPSKRDHGFEILCDGSQRRLLKVPEVECPPFYDARVHHFTEHYQGWKWSRWTGSRVMKSLEVRPGPADYTIVRKKTHAEICAEKTREHARLASKQLRFLDALQRRSIMEGRPGPADYYPELPKDPEGQYSGPKSERFPVPRREVRPGPADHSIPRDFDLPDPPNKPCVAKLPPPACFGIKANRFKYTFKQSPGPADYDAGVSAFKKVMHFSKVPFGCSDRRFKVDKTDYGAESEDECLEEEDGGKNKCPKFTWQFKSKAKRFRAFKTEFDPYLPNLSDINKGRVKSDYMQALAPFLSSQGRFRPWFDYMPMTSVLSTPGPGYYNATKPKCYPAVRTGPLFRERRFNYAKAFDTPAPNEYTISGNTEAVLKTYNQRLRDNVKPAYCKFKKIEKRELTTAELELAIIERATRQLDVDEAMISPPVPEEPPKQPPPPPPPPPPKKKDMPCYCKFYATDDEIPKQKLLRTFLYKHPMKTYY